MLLENRERVGPVGDDRQVARRRRVGAPGAGRSTTHRARSRRPTAPARAASPRSHPSLACGFARVRRTRAGRSPPHRRAPSGRSLHPQARRGRDGWSSRSRRDPPRGRRSAPGRPGRDDRGSPRGVSTRRRSGELRHVRRCADEHGSTTPGLSHRPLFVSVLMHRISRTATARRVPAFRGEPSGHQQDACPVVSGGGRPTEAEGTAELVGTILESEEERQALQAKSREQAVFADDLLPGVGDEQLSLRRGLATGGTSTFVVLLAARRRSTSSRAATLAVLAPDIRDSLRREQRRDRVPRRRRPSAFLVLGALPMGWLADRYRRPPIIGVGEPRLRGVRRRLRPGGRMRSSSSGRGSASASRSRTRCRCTAR